MRRRRRPIERQPAPRVTPPSGRCSVCGRRRVRLFASFVGEQICRACMRWSTRLARRYYFGGKR